MLKRHSTESQARFLELTSTLAAAEEGKLKQAHELSQLRDSLALAQKQLAAVSNDKQNSQAQSVQQTSQLMAELERVRASEGEARREADSLKVEVCISKCFANRNRVR